MSLIQWLLIASVVIAVITITAGQLDLFKGNPPNDLGVRDGRLKPPALTPNSVSSQALLYPEHPKKDYAAIAPIEINNSGKATLARIKTIIETIPGTRIIEDTPDYLYLQFTTPVLKFVDDAEFWFDTDTNVIHVRSASRLGKSDLGVNRKRIEKIRSALQQPSEKNHN